MDINKLLDVIGVFITCSIPLLLFLLLIGGGFLIQYLYYKIFRKIFDSAVADIEDRNAENEKK
ncbi:MAG: hypothetical protein JETCAE02_03320 [Anaerolineaceae bacterium]|nr:hypothetical protein [Chloroflexota bacterium]GIK10550.1 MAG: hypothetical protein BroJett001_26160 [Chloroflexota bacterium]GJQ37920.1 MAG: hypothetical protein JETCAE02_03320 [Anaerolineaceae bacterium]